MTIRAYTRISVDARESQSIDQQKHVITRWAEYKHPGVPIEWYSDPGTSGGKPLAQRRNGGRLLEDLTEGDVLVVIKIDRLARSVRDLLDVIEHTQNVGATFTATEQDIDTNGAYGRFMLTLLGALAELERGIVSERIKAARAQFLRDGRYGIGTLPFGFHGVPRESGKGLVVRPILDEGPCVRCRDDEDNPVIHRAEGTLLREALLSVINGASQSSQAAALDLPEATFRNLLSNPRLRGQTPGEGGNLDMDAAILSADEWRQLQGRRTGPQTWVKTDSLAGAFECYKCNARLYLDTRLDRYRCDSKHEGRPTIGRAVADEFLEGWFLGFHGAGPVYVLDRTDDDSERRERLAQLDIELDEVLASLRNARGEERATLTATLEGLQDERDSIEAETPKDAGELVPTGKTTAETWQESTDNERVNMMRSDMRVLVHPASRPEGRFEVIEPDWPDGVVDMLRERFGDELADAFAAKADVIAEYGKLLDGKATVPTLGSVLV